MERRIEKRQLVNILTLFLIVQFAGLLIAFFVLPPSEISSLMPSQISNSQSNTYAVYLVLFIIIVALVMLVIFKMYKGAFLFKAFEAYAIGVPALFLFFLLILAVFPNLNEYLAVAIAAIIAALLVISKNKWPKLRNTAVVVSSIGIGIVIGFEGFYFAYLIMAIIAVYDYIAVFITKHMQVMAKAMQDRNLAFLIGSSDTEMIPGSYLDAKERAKITKSIKPDTIKNPEIKRMVEEGAYPTVSQVALGAGDLALPLMLTIGAYLTFADIFIPLLMIIGSGVGLLITMQVLQRYKVPLPAIPPLFAAMNLFIGIALFASGKASIILSFGFVALFIGIMLILFLTLEHNKKRAAAN